MGTTGQRSKASLVVKRWRRRGVDRLSVTTGDGQRLGWADLTTGEHVVTDRRDEGVVRAAVDEWLSQHGSRRVG